MNQFYKLTIAFLLISSTLFAQDEKGRWTPEHIINTEYARSTSFSPDGNMLVWTKRKAVKKKDRFVNNIWLTRLNVMKEGKPLTVQLTNSDDNDFSPFFSKDSETIYFLSGREKGKKLWSMSVYGGEPKAVNEFKNGISSIRWIDANTIAFTANDGKTLYDQEIEESKDNTVVVEDSLHWRITKVYSFDLKGKTIKRLSENDFPVSSYGISEGGKWMVTKHTMSRHFAADANPKPKYYLYNLESGTKEEIFSELKSSYGFTFTKNGAGFYFTSLKTISEKWESSSITELYYFDLSSKKYTKVDLGWANGIGGGGFQVVGEDVYVSLADGPLNQQAFYEKEGNSWTKTEVDLAEKDAHVRISTTTESGDKLMFMHSTAMQIPRYYTATPTVKKGKMTWENQSEVIELNANLKKLPKVKAEIYKWTGALDEEVNGMLYYPENYEEGKRYPLILSIHGGPTGVDSDAWSERWSTYPQILAQKGAFVLKPNYHGSGNHPLEFTSSINDGNYYDLEMIDIYNAIQDLNKKGMIDMDMLGTMGWSNGAILSTMLSLRYPDMFKFVASGAGDVNWTSDYGTCRFGVSFDQNYIGGAPWDDVDGTTYNEIYILKSPLFEIEKIKAPTIIFHGSEDRAVPRDQGWEYYRGLQQVGKTPVRFLWFPGQPHGLQKITHQTRKMKEEIAWIDKYLFDKAEEKNEAFKEGSPLALLLKQQKRAHQNGVYGMMENGVLIPEVVSLLESKISVGVFEVTNAQYKAYKSSHNFNAGMENYPVAGISIEDAEGYVKWLSEKTATTYRLPTETEAKKWHKTSHKTAAKENSLNLWAGYSPTPKDALMLQDKLKEVKLSMLKTVGSFKPSKVEGAELYDLGGNVAELYQGSKTYGYSAYDYVDAHSTEVNPEKRGIGFRVVKE